ncbi:uncharacterized protein LOC132167638 [Corylus avellana]|uniref:uncharacterized protein LOC132167638 n=1 Tax=Corylus avellana TaxID=13451 RepID=UPI00286D029B|nr:uncharacterized protein LOC132167638 [Corylus avellana]
MSATPSRQKSYADNQRRPLEFNIGDHVFLKISPMRGVMRFGKKGKLSPRFIGPLEITQRIRRLAYRVALSLDLVRTHDIFHMSMLWKYIANPDAIVEYESLGIQVGLTYVEEPMKIMDKKKQVLRTKTIPIVKLFEDNVVPVNGWEEIAQEPTEPDNNDSTNERTNRRFSVDLGNLDHLEYSKRYTTQGQIQGGRGGASAHPQLPKIPPSMVQPALDFGVEKIIL